MLFTDNSLPVEAAPSAIPRMIALDHLLFRSESSDARHALSRETFDGTSALP
jgi:hypothetical protein